MREWIDHYKQAMYSSSMVGISAALFVASCVVYDIAYLFGLLSGEGSVTNVAVRNALYLQHFAIVVGVFALWRIVVLAWSKSHSFAWQILSWWLLVASIFFYLGAASPAETASCSDGSVCYGIYDIASKIRFVGLGGILFILCSGLRFLITFAYILLSSRPK